jgi:hypothetical protein
MAAERCPSCGATVRPVDPWCTLCWADLRPKPEPVAPQPAAPISAFPAVVPAATVPGAPPQAVATVDPLTAPLGALLGQPLAADPAAPSAATWPCVECGAANALDLDACGTCTAPFGGRVSRLPDPQAARRRVLMIGLGGVAVFLALLAALTFASTSTGGTGGSGGHPDPWEQQIDYSSLPQG